MTDGLIQKLEKIQQLSKEFMRDFTNEETEILLEHGISYFIYEYLGMNEKEYNALNKMRKIISAYCTQSVDNYEKEIEKDIEIPYYTLKTIVNDLETKMKSNVEKECKNSCSGKEEKDIQNKAKALCDMLNLIPKNANNWIECYVKYVKDHKSVLDVLKSDNSGYTEDEKAGDVLDAIKDATIDACIEVLRKKGEIELDPEIMSEVTSKLWHSEENIRINIVNNKLKVEFK